MPLAQLGSPSSLRRRRWLVPQCEKYVLYVATRQWWFLHEGRWMFREFSNPLGEEKETGEKGS